jgi:alanine dehydrogenase
MIIGVPKEIKPQEYRVGTTPANVHSYTKARHKVLIEKGAGLGSGITDAEYRMRGATIVNDAKSIYKRADMIIKIKEPLPPEYKLIRSGQIVFTYFHFAASKSLTEAMQKSGAICIAYETISENGKLPLLTPMSEVAGRMAIQEGAKFLESPFEGRGILLGGVPGVRPANVVVFGGGVVGTNAAKMAAGLGANVTIMDTNLDRLRYLEDIMAANVTPIYSQAVNIEHYVTEADLVVGAVLISGAKAPKLVTRKMLKSMKPGSVIVDVCIDQGGCFETSRPTTHHKPTYMVDGVVHYCVANMPGAVPRTSTFALTNATMPYAREIASKGYVKAIKTNPAIAKGLNVIDGQITFGAVAKAFKKKYIPWQDIIK